jgi:Rod binding domain-containing protein
MDVAAIASKPLDDSRMGELKKVFNEFTAGTFYREMLEAMRKGTGKPAYFDGGQAEEIFRGELDRQIATRLTEQHGEQFSKKLYENFSQQLLAAPRA